MAVDVFTVVAEAEAWGSSLIPGVRSAPRFAAEDAPPLYCMQFSHFRETINCLSQMKTSTGFLWPCVVEEVKYLYVQLLLHALK